MLSTLQYSLNEILDLYKQKDRGFYNFSFLFLLLSSSLCFLFGLVVLYLASSFYQLDTFGVYHSFFELMFQPTIWFHLKNCILYLTTASIGLYASYLQTVLPNPEETLTLTNFLKFMDHKYWTRYLLVMAGLILFYSITFVDLFEIGPAEQEGIMGLLDQYEEFERDNRWDEFYRWLNSMIQLTGMFLPYFAAFFLVLWNEYPVMNNTILKIFWKHMWLCLIISFCLLSLSNNIIYHIDEYLIKLLVIPFKVEPTGYLVSIIVSWLTIILFYPAFAGAILFPILKTEADNRNTTLEIEQETKIE